MFFCANRNVFYFFIVVLLDNYAFFHDLMIPDLIPFSQVCSFSCSRKKQKSQTLQSCHLSEHAPLPCAAFT